MSLDKYKSKSWAVAKVLELTGVSEERSLSIEEYLEDSAGTKGEEMIFRPFYVAARFLEQDQSKQSLVEAGDVKFTGLVTVIASLMAQQAALDTSLGLTIPPGMEPVPAISTQEAVSKRRVRSRAASYLPLNVHF